MSNTDSVFSALSDIEYSVVELDMTIDCLNLYIELVEKDVSALKKNGASAINAYFSDHGQTQSLIHIILANLANIKNQIGPGITVAFDEYMASRKRTDAVHGSEENA